MLTRADRARLVDLLVAERIDALPEPELRRLLALTLGRLPTDVEIAGARGFLEGVRRFLLGTLFPGDAEPIQ